MPPVRPEMIGIFRLSKVRQESNGHLSHIARCHRSSDYIKITQKMGYLHLIYKYFYGNDQILVPLM